MALELLDDSERELKARYLFATTLGTIGVLGSISSELYQKLRTLEENMRIVTAAVGGLDHCRYRRLADPDLVFVAGVRFIATR